MPRCVLLSRAAIAEAGARLYTGRKSINDFVLRARLRAKSYCVVTAFTFSGLG
ncbi:hypothetical protein PILCRDRAFT_814818 [Piloderma croceum F 1598]|uniref:Uncharacterized protein n=1 Tax=Piloderma croceum (strain F 1598) TaxID=765440 RepID=A0A0C3CCC0_PILCF|nr:hypothetical protein PILCRDRAFT_814818 [Piloderma croceum F 1598]